MRWSESADSAADSGLGVRPDVGRFDDVFERLGPVPLALPDVRGRGVRGDAVHPRRELRLAAELPDRPPSSQVRLLHHVARVLLVPREAARERKGVDEGAAHQLVERISVAALCGADQLGFVHRLPFRG